MYCYPRHVLLHLTGGNPTTSQGSAGWRAPKEGRMVLTRKEQESFVKSGHTYADIR